MKKKNNISIYIAAHKKSLLPEIDGYIPLHVGREGKKDLGYIGDNTGDNISLKNSNFCELTGLYWMYKNVRCENIGLVHYRRYFFNGLFKHKFNDILKKEDIEKILKDYDIIVPKKYFVFDKSNYDNYKKLQHIKDLDICRDIIVEKFPDYAESFDDALNEKYFYPYNMFIMKKDIFNQYIGWLFDILFEVEKRVDISNYSEYDKRIFGFLSERLFNVWIEKNNNFKLKELNVYNVEENFAKQILIKTIKKLTIW